MDNRARVLLDGKEERRGGGAPVVRGMIVPGENEGLEAVERLGLDAGVGHVEPRRPDDGVDDELAEIGVPPVPVEMATGETEAAAAVGAFHGPTHCKVIRLVRGPRDDDWT